MPIVRHDKQQDHAARKRDPVAGNEKDHAEDEGAKPSPDEHRVSTDGIVQIAGETLPLARRQRGDPARREPGQERKRAGHEE
jgi:hypothetical protein